MNRSRRIAVAAALTLLFAQLGAMAHAYTHRPWLAQPSANEHTQAAHEFCGDCLNYAPLLAAAGIPAAPHISIQRSLDASPAARPDSFLDHRVTLAFRSRAPPLTR